MEYCLFLVYDITRSLVALIYCNTAGCLVTRKNSEANSPNKTKTGFVV